MSEKISVVMIVKNEEAVLEKCLSSVRDFDEIVILDTGSTDNTSAIASKFTDKYIANVYQWNDNFAEARNLAKSYATGDWLFTIDADEWLEEGGVEKIREAVRTAKVRVFNLRVISKNKTLEHKSPRLKKNDPDIFVKGAIHNYLSVPGQEDLNIVVYYGYSPSHKNDPDRALRILKKELDKNPDLGREKFYLAREYYYRKDWDEAIKWYEKYLLNASWLPEIAEACIMLAECWKAKGNWQRARNICLKAIGINPDFKRALKLMASLSFPDNAAKWNKIADAAQNKDVLFA